MFWHKKEAAKALPDLPPMKFTPAQSPAVLVPSAPSSLVPSAPSSLVPSAPFSSNPPAQSSLSEDEAEAADMPEEKHALPSFPDSPLQKGFAQAAIKDAVATPDMSEEHEISGGSDFVASSMPSASSIKTVEVDEGSADSSLELPAPPVLQVPSSPSLRQAPRGREMSSPLPPPPSFPQPMRFPTFSMPSQRAQKNTDIFVKLDRFTSAKRALEATNQKLGEIDSLLHKIRETKMREEQELASWEKDLATIKARIKEVTETIFEKVD